MKRWIKKNWNEDGFWRVFWGIVSIWLILDLATCCVKDLIGQWK